MTRYLLATALTAAACTSKDRTAATGPSLPSDAYLHASLANLRDAPDSSRVVDKLRIGTPLTVMEIRGRWARVAAPHASGWLTLDLIGAQEPTVEWALAQHDALPFADIAGRRTFAERAAALAPQDLGALERLVAALERAGDAAALKKAREGLKSARANLRKDALLGVVVVDGASARAAAQTDSELVDTFKTGDVVEVVRLAADETPAAGGAFVPVMAKDSRAWLPQTAVLITSIHHVFDNLTYSQQEYSTEPVEAVAWRATPVVGEAVTVGPFYERLLKHPHAATRRRTVAALTELFTSELNALEDGSPTLAQACAVVAMAWSVLLDERDREVRGAAHALITGLDGDKTACVMRDGLFQDALRELLKKPADKWPPAERQQIDDIVASARGVFAQDAQMMTLLKTWEGEAAPAP